MKLSTANLSQKLQKIKPIKKMSGKLKKAAGASSADKRDSKKRETEPVEKPPQDETAVIHKSKSAIAHPVPGFIQNSKLVQNSKSARVAFHLLLVKPWVLVVGLWLVSALSAVVALEGLISPGKLTADMPESTVEVAPAPKTNSFIDVEQSAEGIAGDGSEAEASAGESADVADSASRPPIWPLVMLVGSCAAGCVVISRRRAMLRMAAARTRRGRKPQMAKTKAAPIRLQAANRKPHPRSAASVNKQASVAAFKATARSADQSKSAAGITREKKRRQRKRPGANSISHKPSSKKRVLVSRSTAQQAVPQSRVSQPGKSNKSRQKVARLVRRQPVVSVVPANHSNRLDWAEGSLAHDMDRRFAMGEASRKRAAM